MGKHDPPKAEERTNGPETDASSFDAEEHVTGSTSSWCEAVETYAGKCIEMFELEDDSFDTIGKVKLTIKTTKPKIAQLVSRYRLLDMTYYYVHYHLLISSLSPLLSDRWHVAIKTRKPGLKIALIYFAAIPNLIALSMSQNTILSSHIAVPGSCNVVLMKVLPFGRRPLLSAPSAPRLRRRTRSLSSPRSICDAWSLQLSFSIRRTRLIILTSPEEPARGSTAGVGRTRGGSCDATN